MFNSRLGLAWRCLLGCVVIFSQEKRDERRALERRAALEDAEAKRAVELAKADAAAERRREMEVSRLAHLEEDARREKAARAMEDARWLQVTFPLVANKMIAWRQALTPDQEASVKARVSHLVRFQRCNTTVAVPFFGLRTHALPACWGMSAG